jgi:hypothetical protein
MSGAGYALSVDVATAYSHPPVEPIKMLNEDAYLGLALLPYNVRRVSSAGIFPNGIRGKWRASVS